MLISHDRALLEAVAVHDRDRGPQLNSYPAAGPSTSGARSGSLPENLERRTAMGHVFALERVRLDRWSRSRCPRSPRREGRAQGAASPVSKNRLKDQQQAEQAVQDAEDALKVLEDQLAEPAAWATSYERKSQARHTAAKCGRGRLSTSGGVARSASRRRAWLGPAAARSETRTR